MRNNHDINLEAWMRELAASADPAAVLPDPDLIWSKAQLRRSMEAADEATRPIRLTERLGSAACVLTATVLLVQSRMQIREVLDNLDQSGLLPLAAIMTVVTLGVMLSLLREIVWGE